MLQKIVFVSMLVTSASINAQSLKENLIHNGDFAQGDKAWQLEYGMSVSTTPEENEMDFSDNTSALLMHALEAPQDGYIHSRNARQCVPIGEARKLQFSGDFLYRDELPASNYGHRANLIWHYEADCSGNAQFGWFLEPKIKSGWQSLFIADVEPALNAKAVEIEISQDQHSSRKDFMFWEAFYYWVMEKLDLSDRDTLSAGYWDNLDLQITQLEEPDPALGNLSDQPTTPHNINLLRNGNFDNSLEDWKHYYSEWNANEGSTKKGAVRVTLKSSTGSSGSGVFEQCVNIGNHRRFTMGANFKVDEVSSQTGGGRMRVSWYEEENCRGRHSTDSRHVDPQKIPGWQQLSVPFLDAPRNSRSVSVDAIQSIDGKGEFSAFWDDMYFMAIE